MLFSKSLTYVVTALPSSLRDWYSWFVVAAFLGTAAFWVRQSDRGLRLYPASLIMPLMQVGCRGAGRGRVVWRLQAGWGGGCSEGGFGLRSGGRAVPKQPLTGRPAPMAPRQAQAFWMVMSVVEGGIYFEELVLLPANSLLLLMLGLALALAGAVAMG